MRKPIAALACAALVLAACQHKTDQAANSPHQARIAPSLPAATAARPRAPLSAEVSGYMDKEEADLRARLLAAGVSVNRQRDRIIITMDSDTAFTANGEQVQPQFYQVLASTGEVLTRYDRTGVEVSGHVDSAVAAERGQTLSRRQADAVVAVLKQHGVTQSRIRTEGVGKARPVASNATSAGRAKNRRVEIQIVPLTP